MEVFPGLRQGLKIRFLLSLLGSSFSYVLQADTLALPFLHSSMTALLSLMKSLLSIFMDLLLAFSMISFVWVPTHQQFYSS